MRPRIGVAAVAFLAIAATTIGSSAIQRDSTHGSADPQSGDLGAIALVAALGGPVTPGADPVPSVGILPSRPNPPRLRALGSDTSSSPERPVLRQTGTGDLAPRGSAFGIPELVLAAYRNAELALGSTMPGCGLSWNLLAGIGKIESDHAGDGRTDVAGTTTTAILGPALDGSLPGNEVISAGAGQGYVRAVGPMQFLPETWQHWSADGNGDGVADPNNVFDATLAAGKYLCADGVNLDDPADRLAAILRYNHSLSYAADVLSWASAYRNGGVPTLVDVSENIQVPQSYDASMFVAAEPAEAGSASDSSQSGSPTTVSGPQTISPIAGRTSAAGQGTAATPSTAPPRVLPIPQPVVRTTDAALPPTEEPDPTAPVTLVPSVIVPTPAVTAPVTQAPGIPGPVDPLPISPQTISPQTISPQTISPQTISPQTLNPQTADPQPANPGPAEPQPANPQPANPQPVNPQPVVPNVIPNVPTVIQPQVVPVVPATN
ncbi:lytic transglycosylase domain-containing protein [Antrihabitans sp. YC2-6]|uniref:lytic transglycosylase domain-containing protein n=1 Tax=Antrihabitans sp. YC2-6 TaxID=2799498 RepID=UPI0018F46352|nr:lytic transglycosylase domain-containing protein [Antrihabitans sp. YC2-6]MBJ8343373.1 lytic murein transglycosylase [Antrihabitans sp. YC2-6]